MSVRFPRLLLLILFVSCGDAGAAPGSTPQAPKQFRAGAAASNITPWLGLSINGYMQDRRVKQIHDELHARSLALDDGRNRIVITVGRQLHDPPRNPRRGQASRGAARHRHSGPTTCSCRPRTPTPLPRRSPSSRATRRGLPSVPDSKNRRQASAAHGNPAGEDRLGRWRKVPTAGLQPALEDEAGHLAAESRSAATDQVKMNPPAGSPGLVEPAGPIDPDVSILSVQAPDGRPIALLAQLLAALRRRRASRFRPTISGRSPIGSGSCWEPKVSSRPSSASSRTARAATSTTSTSGRKSEPQRDLLPRRGASPTTWRKRRCGCTRRSSTRPGSRLTRARRRSSWGSAAPGLRGDSGGPGRSSPRRRAPRCRPCRRSMPARPCCSPSTRKRFEVAYPGTPDRRLGIVAIPCEMFVEIGLELKQKSPLQPAFIIELANGYNGYLPTVEQHKLGGYETWRARSSYLEVEAAPKIVDRLVAFWPS